MDWHWVLGASSIGILCALNFLAGYFVGKAVGTLVMYNADHEEDIEARDVFDDEIA